MNVLSRVGAGAVIVATSPIHVTLVPLVQLIAAAVFGAIDLFCNGPGASTGWEYNLLQAIPGVSLFFLFKNVVIDDVPLLKGMRYLIPI